MDECIASQCLALPSICLTAFHFSPLQGGRQWGRGMGYATSSVKDANGFFFKRSPFFGAYYGNASASNALSPWRGLPSHSSSPSSSCFAHAPPSFSMTSSNGQHYRGHRYGLRIALKLARKKKKQRNARWHFLSVAATDPLPFMVSRGGKKHFRILMCRLLPFMAAQLTTTTATKRPTTANRARQQDSCQLALSEKAAVLQTWP